jgi:hypothetical protein
VTTVKPSNDEISRFLFPLDYTSSISVEEQKALQLQYCYNLASALALPKFLAFFIKKIPDFAQTVGHLSIANVAAP